MKHQENDGKETKKIRKKRSARTAQQIKLAVIMIMVSVMILSASTFAWYQMSKTAKVTNMQFKADTMGNLQICKEKDGTYTNSISLGLTEDGATPKLLPATTSDGVNFKKPHYDPTGMTVDSIEDFGDGEFSKYVYTTDFYIKSGSNSGEQTYSLKLVASDNTRSDGTYIKDSNESDTKSGFTALNAVRISFVFGDGATIPDDGNNVTIYEPSTAGNSEGGLKANNSAVSTQYGPNAYSNLVIKQENNGTFSPQNHTLCTITEGKPVHVTMYVWLEGNDDDCENEIALDTILGQIQFIAE